VGVVARYNSRATAAVDAVASATAPRPSGRVVARATTRTATSAVAPSSARVDDAPDDGVMTRVDD
jgi:hypothetical protein